MAGSKRSRPRRAPGSRALGGRAPDPVRTNKTAPVATSRSSEPASQPVAGIRARDGVFAAGLGGGAGLVFFSTFSTHVALGDAPESVSGVKTLGVLHAPGYPTYVFAARVFADVVPIGGWGLRVNLFSVVCAALTVAAMFLLSRSFGSSVVAASIAALTLATTASFWFNAGFAKHYALSGLLVVTGALLAVMWQERGRPQFLVASGMVLGAGFGASWELALIMTVGVAALVATGPRRLPLLHALGAAIGLCVVAGAALLFMVWRARHDPAVNWGDVTNIARLIEQVTQRDFQSQSQSASGVGAVPGRLAAYLAIITRDVGFGAIAAALVGVVVAATRITRDRKIFLGVVALANLVSVIFTAGIDSIRGFFTGLFSGGYLIDFLVVVTVLAALGATRVIEAFEEWSSGRRPSVNARRRLGREQAGMIAGAALALILIAPSLVTHYAQADHRMPPLADLYGRRVLAALPPHSVLLVGGYEFSEPMTYRQIVDGDRPDVSIISADLLGLQWYRQELARRMRLGPAFDPTAKETNTDTTVQLAQLLRATRPVYLDTFAMLLVGNRIGYQAQGLVGRVVNGTGPHPSGDPEAQAAALDQADQADGLAGHHWPLFPNQFVYLFHQRAHIELAKQFLLAGNLTGVERQLQHAHALVPDDTPTQIALTLLQHHDPQARDFIRNL